MFIICTCFEREDVLILMFSDCCPSGVQPAVSLGGERSVKEQREAGGADGAAEADRLLVEELKGELSQTKLELETTLKAQHKHLKELDTLRSDTTNMYPTHLDFSCVYSRAIVFASVNVCLQS